MTDIRKLAEKHARGFDDPKVKHAIVHALQELEKRVVLDVTVSDPSTNLVAERIIRNRPLPRPRGYYPGAVASERIEYLDIIRYAVEMGRELERLKQPQPEQEYGWDWNSGPYPRKTFQIYGATTLEQAREMLSQTINLEHATIMVRDKAVPGEWREA